MITFGETIRDKKNELLERTQVSDDGVKCGEIVSSTIGHQFNSLPGFVDDFSVYKTLAECKNGLY